MSPSRSNAMVLPSGLTATLIHVPSVTVKSASAWGRLVLVISQALAVPNDMTAHSPNQIRLCLRMVPLEIEKTPHDAANHPARQLRKWLHSGAESAPHTSPLSSARAVSAELF